jgi:hypothetical protein
VGVRSAEINTVCDLGKRSGLDSDERSWTLANETTSETGSRRAGAAEGARHVIASDTSLCRMDPTVIAAAIGVGGTVIVALAGFSTAVWTTKGTIKHARESRVWDRRADVYIDALAAVNYRQIRRGFETLTQPVDDQARQRTQAYLAGQEQDWPGLEARLQAFASEPVFGAVQASSTVHRDAIKSFGTWRAMAVAPGSTDEHREAVATQVGEARKAADAADDAVVELIRAELQGRGRPLADWQTFPEP